MINVLSHRVKNSGEAGKININFMHKILLSIVLFFASISSAIAQKLTIESFKLAGSDLTAQTQSRKDLNDRNCALVKVQLVGDILNVEGNVIMPLVKRNNETWVYMPQNTRQMKVITKNFLLWH